MKKTKIYSLALSELYRQRDLEVTYSHDEEYRKVAEEKNCKIEEEIQELKNLYTEADFEERGL